MKAYIIVQTKKGVDTPIVLSPGYLDEKVAERKLEELNAPRIAYYEWETAKQSYVHNSAEWAECIKNYETASEAYRQKQSESNRFHWDCPDLNKAMKDGINALTAIKSVEKELEAEFKETNPKPQVDWDITHTIEEVEVDIHTHSN